MKKALLILLGLLTFARAVHADPIWIDVRSAEEYASDHIDGDANIPLATLDAASLAATYGKDAEIMLYCRSGNRAGQAQDILRAAGFTNVVNAGGIADVRSQRELLASPAASEAATPAR